MKLKDNVKFEELEKNGIYPTPIIAGKSRIVYQNELWCFPSGLMIDINSREILLHSGEYDIPNKTWTGKHTTTLYDLIKDGLVEKVD